MSTPEPTSNVEAPVDAPVQNDDETIAQLRQEIADLKSQGKTPEAPSPSVETVAPEDVPAEAAPAPDKNARPLLANAVDDNGNALYPTNEDGTPNMREPGIHQNPVFHAHLDNGEVVQIMGAIPTYIHDAETGLHKVIAAWPLLMDEGRQMVAGLFKGI